MRRNLYTEEHQSFRAAFRAFLDREAVPYAEAWEASGAPDRAFLRKAGEAGYVGFELDPEHGGLGVGDFRYNAVMTEEVVASGMSGDMFSMQNDIILPYLRDLTTPEQRDRWCKRFAAGDLVTALGMTEPGAGSDLTRIETTARRDGDDLVLSGSKTFITSGATCELAIVLAKTGERDGRGTTLVAVEWGAIGFERGRPMHKIGRRGQDTAELFFDDVRVPASNVLGGAGRGFASAMTNLPRERLSIAISAVASARRAHELALDHVVDREAFGARLADMQSVRMSLAEMWCEIDVMQTYVDRCVVALNDRNLTPEEAAGCKRQATELQWSVVDRVLQMFGGYGYMEEYPIARIWRDARIQRIYGGANEVMLDLIGRRLVARRG